LFQVEGNDIVKKKVPATESGGVVEMGLSGFSKKKELTNERKSNGRAETIPIKPSALKCYSAAEESNMNGEPLQCNVNLGYDATGDEECMTVTGTEGQTREKDANISDSETHKRGKGSEKHTKERETGAGEKKAK
jgi:hypothetical protein